MYYIQVLNNISTNMLSHVIKLAISNDDLIKRTFFDSLLEQSLFICRSSSTFVRYTRGLFIDKHLTTFM